MPEPPKVKATAPDRTDLAWVNHAQADKQKEPERLEDTAKFLAGVITVSLTLFLTNRPKGLPSWTEDWYAAATIAWMTSALLGFFVLFPWRYRFNKDNPESIQSAYRKITKVKRTLLVLSLACLFLALGLAAYAYMDCRF